MDNNKKFELSIEDANLLDLNGVESEMPDSSEYLRVRIPEALKVEVEKLANERVRGTVSNSDVHASLKSWVAQLKESGVEIALETLKSDFAEMKERIEQKLLENADEQPKEFEVDLHAASEFGRRDLVKTLQEAAKALGYIYTDTLALAMLHVFGARLCHRKTGFLIFGRSRSGKSRALEIVFNLTHPSNRMRATSITPGALYQMGVIDHKFILGGELTVLKPGEDDIFQQTLRQWLSEPELTHIRLEKTKSGNSYEQVKNTVSGVASVAWTSTKDPYLMKDEFVLRLILLSSDDSRITTENAQTLTADRAVSPEAAEEQEKFYIEAFHNYDLSLKHIPVKIPFAHAIKIESSDTTARSTYEQLLQQTEISTLLHQHQRELDGRYLISTLADPKAAYDLVNDGAFRLFNPISKTCKTTFEEISKVVTDGEGFSIPDLQKMVRIPRSTLQDHLIILRQSGVVEELPEKGVRNAKRYKILSRQLPEGLDLGLVEPDRLQHLFDQDGKFIGGEDCRPAPKVVPADESLAPTQTPDDAESTGRNGQRIRDILEQRL